MTTWKREPFRSDRKSTSCRPPYSFFLKLMNPLDVYRGQQTCGCVLHRICTIARKLYAEHVFMECALGQKIVEDELDRVDELHGGGGRGSAVSITFLTEPFDPESSTPFFSTAILGQAIVLKYYPPAPEAEPYIYVLEAIIDFTARHSGQGIFEQINGIQKNYLHVRGEFLVQLAGMKHGISGVYFCQKSRVEESCAHATLRMAIKTLRPSSNPSVPQISAASGGENPGRWLGPDEMMRVIEAYELVPERLDYRSDQPRTYLDNLYACIESGDPVILAFKTDRAGPELSHSVLCFGHTLNTDVWHPYAESMYTETSDERTYLSTGTWVDHFVVHDEVLGPYFFASRESLIPGGRFTHDAAIAIRRKKNLMHPLVAEELAAGVLHNIQALVDEGDGGWSEFLGSREHIFVLRSQTIDNEAYLEHIAGAKAHDGSHISPEELPGLQSALGELPPRFWVIEFTLTDIYAGNASKLGEVLLSTARQSGEMVDFAPILAVRVPGQFLSLENGRESGRVRISIQSHIPMIGVKTTR